MCSGLAAALVPGAVTKDQSVAPPFSVLLSQDGGQSGQEHHEYFRVGIYLCETKVYSPLCINSHEKSYSWVYNAFINGMHLTPFSPPTIDEAGVIQKTLVDVNAPGPLAELIQHELGVVLPQQ